MRSVTALLQRCYRSGSDCLSLRYNMYKYQTWCLALTSKQKKLLYNIFTMLGQCRRRWADAVQMLYKCVSGYCGLVVCDAGPTLTQRLEGLGCEERGTGRSGTTNERLAGPGCEERGHRGVGYNQRLAGPGCEERGHRKVAHNQRLAGPGCEERGTGRSATTNDWRVQDVKKGGTGRSPTTNDWWVQDVKKGGTGRSGKFRPTYRDFLKYWAKIGCSPLSPFLAHRICAANIGLTSRVCWDWLY